VTDSIEQFVEDLARERTDALVNQYAAEVPGLDRPGGAAIRCANLRAYLEPRIGAPLALIGEAPSAHGARFSGIAFTAERSLAPEQWTSAPGLRRNGFTEHSATILRRALEAIELDPAHVVLWNAVPFHPARFDDPLRNRRPSPAEFALGARWLERLLALMQPARIAAVGRSAQRLMPDGTTPLRHPAYGGGAELRDGLSMLIAGIGDGSLREV
jgi:uracil-DNA glycosylase